ncbi:hypothetical protein [Nonomuraea zeae]|nr:hypothetical protein [Nonomuraea zeae]
MGGVGRHAALARACEVIGILQSSADSRYGVNVAGRGRIGRTVKGSAGH